MKSQILEYLQTHAEESKRDMCGLVAAFRNMSADDIRLHLNELAKDGLVQRYGNGKRHLWRVMSNKPFTVEPSTRQVLEKQLLTSLDDKSKVALLCTKEDVNLLIQGLARMMRSPGYLHHNHATEFRDGLLQLRKEAFGE